MPTSFRLFLGTLLFVGAAQSNALIVGFSGQADSPAAPASLVRGQFQADDLIRGINEGQGIFSANAVDVNVANPTVGTNYTGDSNTPPASTPLKAGTYNSHILHFDPSTNSGTHNVNGTFVFDTRIVAFIFGDPQHEASDGLFGAAGTAYDSSASVSRRLEGSDRFQLLSARELQIDLFRIGGSNFDQLRVLTVPEPGSLAGFGAGMLALLALRGRRLRG